ncbi:MAG: rhodanese-like domain-containing protein, partial [Candidatus Dormibacteraeota bacterium]|nr:rhodanese-like domain-containing protein [Candidatus Dormibacteraeota bacterium]
MPDPLVSAGWLAQHLADPDLSVLDFRWYLDGGSGAAAYAQGHIPGAVFVDLAEVTGDRSDAGRHPLPGRQQFQAAMRRAGLRRSSQVVVYDDQGGFTAARLWFLLRYFGHPEVYLLDGGWQAWRGQKSREPVTVTAGDFEAAEPLREWALDYAGLQSRLAGAVLIDA